MYQGLGMAGGGWNVHVARLPREYGLWFGPEIGRLAAWIWLRA